MECSESYLLEHDGPILLFAETGEQRAGSWMDGASGRPSEDTTQTLRLRAQQRPCSTSE